ncbi:MAG: hypothetical protein IJL88_06560 [Clostridia bacterium]|nr:hypothetical protein [Clostridia bacterium]
MEDARSHALAVDSAGRFPFHREEGENGSQKCTCSEPDEKAGTGETGRKAASGNKGKNKFRKNPDSGCYEKIERCVYKCLFHNLYLQPFSGELIIMSGVSDRLHLLIRPSGSRWQEEGLEKATKFNCQSKCNTTVAFTSTN